MSHDPMDATTSARPSGGAPRRLERITRAALLPAALILGVGLALFIYRPWHGLPFDIRDFSEFLPLLLHNDSLVSRLHAFVEYYASQGRLNLLSYLFLVLKWSVFGRSTAGWQLARFIQMCAIVAGVVLVLRRLGAGRRGAVAGAALFIVASTAVPAWTRLTMGEPLGVVAILGALWLATRYQVTPHWRRDSVAIAILLAVALLAKEMLVVTVPFVVAIALCFEGPDRVVVPESTDRNLRVLITTGVAAVLVLVPVAVTALGVSSGRFAAQYGSVPFSAARTSVLFQILLLPVHPTFAPRIKPLFFPANVVFLLLVIAGWRLAIKREAERTSALVMGGLALSLPLLAAIAYAPWPLFEDFYGLPFLLGSAMLVAFAVTFIERYAPRSAWIAYAGCVIMLSYSTMTAQHSARASAARQRINSVLARTIATNAQRDSIVVAMRFVPRQRWVGTGPTLGRYALVNNPGINPPRVQDAVCAMARPMYAAMYAGAPSGAMLVTYSDQCGAFPQATQSFRTYYRYMYWPTLRIRTDSLRADVLAPARKP